MDKKIGNIAESVEEIRIQVAALPQDVEGSLQLLQTDLSTAREQLEARQKQLVELESRIAELDQQKIDKPTMDLALRLEALKMEQNFKARMDALEAKLESMEAQIKQRPSSPTPPASPGAPQPSPTPSGPSSPQKIEEQTIPR